MRITIYSNTGFGLGYVAPLEKEGHSVVKNLIGATIPAFSTSGGSSDIVIYDSNQYYLSAEQTRARGIRVLGPSNWSNLLDTNQDYKSRLIEAIGYKQGYQTDSDIRVKVVCWFNGQRFISKSLVFNYRKMMAGGAGADIPSAGYVSFFKVEDSKLVNDILTPLEKYLRKANHRGCFSIEVGITEKGEVIVSDISANSDLAYTQAVTENTRRSRSDLLLDLFNENSQSIPYINPYVSGVLLSIYPYPFTSPSEVVTVVGVNPENTKHMWLMNSNGLFSYVNARGTTVWEAKRRVYRTISNLKGENLQFRNDIGEGIYDILHVYKKFGLIKEVI